MKKLLALLVACATVTCAFVSCGDDEGMEISVSESSTEENTESATEEETAEPTTEQDEVSAFVGKWQGVKIIEYGQELDIYEGIPVYAYYQIELCEDGSVKLGETTAEIVGDENSLKWNRTSAGNEIEFFESEDDENSSILKLDGDYLIYEGSNDTVYLERVDEFRPYQYDEKENISKLQEYFTGKWQGYSLVVDGESYTEYMDMPVYAMYQYELKEDGTVEINNEMLGGYSSSYTWSLIGAKKIEMVNEYFNSVVLTLEGDFLVIKDDDLEFYLEKVDEFTPFDMEAFIESFTEEETEESSTEPEQEDPFMCKWQGEYVIDENGEKFFDDVIPKFYQIELKEDGVVELGGGGLANDSLYSWEYVDTDTVKFVPIVPEETLLFVLTGEYCLENVDGKDYLVYEFNGQKAYLERVDEFVPVDFGNFDESED
ncbi:MAG: hypothetical protein NC177_00440 [Ruminococcus flavefaciens]|nr:hypothetical protein [Ruminococcus flavefaciens]